MARTEPVTVVFTDIVGSTELSGRFGHGGAEVKTPALRQRRRRRSGVFHQLLFDLLWDVTGT